VDLLTPFLRPTAATFVRPPVLVRKQVKLVLYGLAHRVSCARIHNLYGCGDSTIRKYTMIVCRALGSGEDGLFIQFIHTPSGDRLQSIIEKFMDITGLPNITEAIDGTHIPLRDPVDDTLLCPKIFTIENIFIVLCCKRFATQIECFGTYVRDNPVVSMMQGNLRCPP
jgi:hypothetical protein